MTSTTVFGSLARCSMARLFGLLALMCSVLIVSVPSASAGYEWCSVDPLLAFQREGALIPIPVDVQVLVPRSQLPYDGQADLRVTVPTNVTGTIVLDTSHPLYFDLRTYFTTSTQVAQTGYYPISLRLMVPTPPGMEPFDTELLITKPNSDKVIARVPGKSGNFIRSTFWVEE